MGLVSIVPAGGRDNLQDYAAGWTQTFGGGIPGLRRWTVPLEIFGAGMFWANPLANNSTPAS